MSDWIAILISFLYVFAMLGMAEGLRKRANYEPDFTRKFVHVAVGMWSVGTVLLFQSRWMAIVPPAVFIILNYLSYRRETFRAIESDDKANLGTIYFPIAFCAIILLFWDYPNILVAALMPLTWGDAMAAVLGKAYGHIQYRFLGHTRTVEGSVSMLVFSLLSTWLALWLVPPKLEAWPSFGVALATSLAAAIAEALSPWGLDNLTVPAISGLALYLLLVY